MIKTIKTISDLHKLTGLPKPKHPLVSVIDLEEMDMSNGNSVWEHYYSTFYLISVKSGCKGNIKYGQNRYDFEEGVLVCFGPNQVVSTDNSADLNMKGFALSLHPDFLLNHPLAQKLRSSDFFSYQVNEALHLSHDEQQIIFEIFKSIKKEYENNIDSFSQEVILSNIDLLLVHISRFYNRQFITRKNHHKNVLSKLELLLSNYYKDHKNEGLPTVQYLADQLSFSAAYLSDMLKNYTGLSAQQHIHESVINKAKEMLSITELTISEIAYDLGFQHPQSFTKLFKQKTNQTPLKFRQGFN